MKRKTKIACAVLFAGALAAACSDSPPLIDQTRAGLIVRLDAKTARTQLELFAFCAVKDGDGVQDIDQFYAIDDLGQTLWELGPSEIQTIKVGGQTWIGGSRLAPPPGEGAGAARLRLFVYDRAGHVAQAAAAVPSLPVAAADIVPRLARAGGELAFSPPLDKAAMERELVALDAAGVELGRFRIRADRVDAQSLALGKPQAELRYFVEDSRYAGTVLLRSGPW